MTAEMLEELRRKCIFVKEWECSIEASEIPLEVCKLCLEARKVHSQHINIARHMRKAEALPDREGVLEREVPQMVSPP